ncbi:MAG: ribonuclease HII [Firmicutes bacterium]|nr:ribonuclease HII [Bacillota bacterium]
MNNTINIDGYNVLNLEACYELKLFENKKKDKKVINKLDLILCSKDNYRYERKLKDKGVKLIAGVDEVGRGPLVGPVVAACVILPDKFNLDGLTDSKKLSEKKRDEFYDLIMKEAISVGVGIIDEKKIDEVNIYEATKLAMKQAINNCDIKPEHILIDAMPLDLDIPTTSIIKGDLKSITISAASVIAKVTRDRMLYELDLKYPMYDFKNNKGYPTKKHLDAIEKYGIIDEHRRSYGPVSDYLNNKRGD